MSAAARGSIVLALLLPVLSAACSSDVRLLAMQATGGDPTRGPAAIRQYGCDACHTIPGVPGAHGRIGPPLTSIGAQSYVAGELPNTPGNMKEWIRHPRKIEPGTVMPDTGVTESDSRDIAAYLYTLR